MSYGVFTRAWFFFTLMILTELIVKGQDTDSIPQKKIWQVQGYVKDLQSLTFDKNFDSLITGNLIHNRVNVRWNPNSKFSGAIEFRNRLFWGEEVRLNPNFSSGIRNSNEAVDASIIWIESKSVVLQTNIDRFWLEYNGQKWNARIGRQRINWGITTTWNPNDIFNTYNFLDFDYEERPGRDALKTSYHFTEMSNIELAVAVADQYNNAVAAIRYFTNKYNYDFQFSAGTYHKIFTLGAGWSGNINDAGFKGELQYFVPHKDTAAQINLSLESDYMFKKGWYLNGALLLNSNGIYKPVNDWSLVYFKLTPQNLMPTKWNVVGTLAKEITPLLSGNFSVVYSPGTNLMILLPSINYSLSSNIYFDLIWQSFFAEQNEEFESVSHRGFIRIKWNF